MDLATERLSIRSFRRDDLDAYAGIVADSDVMRYLGGPLTRPEARAYIERSLEHERTHGFARYAVLFEGDLIGMCGFAPIRDYIDLGYRFAKTSWGNGFATESARAVIEKGFSAFGFDEIVASVLNGNGGSLSVIEKLGFTYQHDELTPGGLAAKRFVLRKDVAGH